MSFNVNWRVYGDNLYDACKESVSGFVDESKGTSLAFYNDLRAFTDRVRDAKKAVAEADSDIKKAIKYQTLLHEQRNLDGLVKRYELVFVANSENIVKEVLWTAVRIVGKIAFSMIVAVA